MPINNPVLRPDLRINSGIRVFQSFAPSVLNLALIIGASIFIFVLILAALQWITAGGDKVALESARNRMANALIGIIIIFSVIVIIKAVEAVFGTQITNFNLDVFNLRP